MKMQTVRGKIFCQDGEFRTGCIQIGENGCIHCISYEEDMSANPKSLVQVSNEDIVLSEGYILPGLVDIHLHGCKGYDFCDDTKEALESIINYEMTYGVTGIVPATMTLPEEELERILGCAGEFMQRMSVLKGICMEGPFIAESKKGAQDATYAQKASVEKYKKWQELARGNIRQITVAPEIPGAIEFIKNVSKETIVSLAHTAATYEQSKEAIEAGANHVTHLFNGMNGLGHREPGVPGAAMDAQDVYVELICDGVHVHPGVVRLAFKVFGPEHICMISDSMSATGMPDGEYFLGGQKVFVSGNQARLEDGSLAGSVCNLYDCLKKVVVEMGIPLKDAVRTCTMTPAKSLGLERECGVIQEGSPADLLLVDDKLNILQVIKSGKRVV